MHLDTTTRGRKTDEALEIISRLWTGETLDYRGAAFQADRGLDRAGAGAAGPADVDRRLLGGGDPANRAELAPDGRRGRKRRRRSAR